MSGKAWVSTSRIISLGDSRTTRGVLKTAVRRYSITFLLLISASGLLACGVAGTYRDARFSIGPGWTSECTRDWVLQIPSRTRRTREPWRKARDSRMATRLRFGI